MPRSALAGVVGFLAVMGVGNTPAGAGGICDCYDHRAGYYVAYEPRAYDYEPRVLAYYEDPRVLRRFHPRWQYAAAYYNPPPRVYGYRPYGYAYVSRGPAVLLHRYGPRWRRRW
jgi:hypothetical protein